MLPQAAPAGLFVARTPTEKFLMVLLLVLGIPFLIGAVIMIIAMASFYH
jgi:hypothetical protein